MGQRGQTQNPIKRDSSILQPSEYKWITRQVTLCPWPLGRPLFSKRVHRSSTSSPLSSTSSPLAITALQAQLVSGRRDRVEVELTGLLRLPTEWSVEEFSLFVEAFNGDGRTLAVEDARPEVERALDGRLPFHMSVRPTGVLDRLEVRAIATVDEVALTWEVPATALPAPIAGPPTPWRGPSTTVQRSPVASDGRVRFQVFGQCPLRVGYRYDRRGHVDFSVIDGIGAVRFHDETRFSTHGGALGPAMFDERFDAPAALLVGAERFAFRMVVQRFESSERGVVGRDELCVKGAD